MIAKIDNFIQITRKFRLFILLLLTIEIEYVFAIISVKSEKEDKMMMKKLYHLRYDTIFNMDFKQTDNEKGSYICASKYKHSGL